MIDINKIDEMIDMLESNLDLEDKQLQLDLKAYRKRVIQRNVENDFATQIGTQVWPDALSMNKRKDGQHILDSFTWTNLSEVPKNLAVFDREGDLWRHFDGNWHYLCSETGRDNGNGVRWIRDTDEDQETDGPWTVFYNFKD